MNTKDALDELVSILTGLIIHPRCIRELKDLLKGELRGKEKEFLTTLAAQLNNLLSFGVMIANVDSHEKLKYGELSLYSIHLQRKAFNIRLLVAFDQSERPCLLTIFYERSGKRKTDYSEVISAAETRFKELSKLEEENE